MDLFRSVRTVTTASGDGYVDWPAVGEAAKASTDAGALDLGGAEREGYAEANINETARVVGGALLLAAIIFVVLSQLGVL